MVATGEPGREQRLGSNLKGLKLSPSNLVLRTHLQINPGPTLSKGLTLEQLTFQLRPDHTVTVGLSGQVNEKPLLDLWKGRIYSK